MLKLSKNRVLIFFARRRWLKRLIKKKLPLVSSFPISFDQKKRGEIFLELHDYRGSSFNIMWGGEAAFYSYEKNSRNRLLEEIKENDFFFDIGANIGLFSFYYQLYRPQLTIFAFEPNRVTYECLNKSKESFKFNNIRIENIALAEKAGEMALYEDSANFGGHSLLKIENESHSFSEESKSLVQTVSFDQYIEMNQIRSVDAIKIDVEGFELNVFKGMERSLRKFHPKIMVESHHQMFKQKENLQTFFESLNIYKEVEHLESQTKIKISEWKNFSLRQLEQNTPASDYLLIPDLS